MQPITTPRAAARSRHAVRRAAFYVVGLAGLFGCASAASAQSFLYANTASYNIVGRAGASGNAVSNISASDFDQYFDTASTPAILNYDVTRDVGGAGAAGHVSAHISAIADRGELGISYRGDVKANTFAALNTGLGIIDSSLVVARWQDTLIFTGNEPGRTTTVAATLDLTGDFGGSAGFTGTQVAAAFTESTLGLAATLNGTSVLQAAPYFASLWGVSTLNALPGTNPAPLNLEPPESATVIMTFTQGQVYTLDYRMAVSNASWALINLAGSAAPREASADWSANFSHTLMWGGITSVTDTLTGLPLENYSLTSASGVDYTVPMPEPGACLLVLGGIGAVLRRRRR